MGQELFNQALKTTLDDTDRVAAGIPSMVGADNITFVNLAKQINTKNVLYGTFSNGDLVDGKWTYNHNKDTSILIFKLYKPSGVEENLSGILRIVSSNTVELDFGGDIDAGNWTYVILYFLV